MQLLIVLCLGTLALSAPAPQKRNQIDFLYDDDEIQASVRPVEINTVEPKVTASKISDQREPAPVFENEEEQEEEVENQEKEPSPMASPLNLEQNASERNEPIVDETDNDDIESLNKTESSISSRTDSAVTDTTIRVYDEDEVNEPTENNERPEKEQENKQEDDQETEHEWDQKQVVDQDIDQEDENENEQQARNNQSNQKAVLDDSYQYDDESLEREKEGSEKPLTEAPEENAEKPGLNGVLNVELNHDTQVVEKGNYGIQDLKTHLTVPVESEHREYAGFVNWDAVHQEAVKNDGGSIELKSGQLFNHGTLILEKGTFEGQDMNHPFNGPSPMKQWKMGERPEFDNWHHGLHGPHGSHGPHGHRGHPGHPNFLGIHKEHHQFDGPPPPWAQRPHFHANHFDRNSHEHEGYNFHGNGFHRDMPTWNNHWENPNPAPLTSGSTTKTALLSE